jgi:predicted dehydrogenase
MNEVRIGLIGMGRIGKLHGNNLVRSVTGAKVDSILKDTPTLVGGKDGLMSVYIAMAANKSLVEHRPVKLTEVMKQGGTV